MRRRLLLLLAILVAVLAHPATAGAEGLLPVVPAPAPDARDGVSLTGHAVRVVVEEQAARYEVTLTLANEGRVDAEADLILPLPGQAAVTGLTLWIDGRQIEAQLLSATEALATYTDIVRQRRDPALLEYAGQGALRARVFPVPAHGTAQVRLVFTQVLTRDAGLITLEYPFQTSLPIDAALQPTFEASITAAGGVGTLYSPTHALEIERTSTGANVRATGEQGRHPEPLVLYYGPRQADIAASILSYREGGEDGFFMLLLTPPEQTKPVAAVERDVILALDTSGSMRGDKLAQTQAAALYVLRNLNAGDRFGLLSFGSSVHLFAEELVGADDIASAEAYIRDLKAEGGTNIDAALAAALALADTQRPQVILFLTDGLPTVGEVDSEAILAHLDERASRNVRLFCFGVGYDVNTELLDRASLDHHGTATYVRPGEDIEQRVASLYDKIRLPALVDVSLDMHGAGVYDIYPATLPDLFAGEQLIIVGRYREPGALRVTLRGTRAERPVEQTFEGLELAREGGAEHIPAVWAARKVGYLLTEIRLHGADEELVDEVTALATEFGIVTPYTSFLADETEDMPPIVAPLLRGPASLDTSIAPQAGSLPETSGAKAVEQSLAEQSLRDSERPATTGKTQTVGGRTFVLTDGVWIDTLYTVGMPEEVVPVGEAQFLTLLSAHPQWGRWLALGLPIVIVDQGQAYRFTE